MIVVDYTESLPPRRGYRFRYMAQHLWGGVVARCDLVHSTDPEILAAYAVAGIPSWESYLRGKTVAAVSGEKKEVLRPKIPDGWMDFSWVQKRSLATQINNFLGIQVPVKNKAQAEQVIKEFNGED